MRRLNLGTGCFHAECCMRLLLATVPALLAGRSPPDLPITCRFRVMPWDVGISTFKSDRYFTVADAAQFDFAIRVGLLRPFLRDGVRWINLAQSCRFLKPLHVFQAYSAITRVLCADERHIYLSHCFRRGEHEHAEVLVKLKFKRARLTIPPARFFPQAPSTRSSKIDALDTLA